MGDVVVERLTQPVGDRDVRDLARLLVDAVESNASVSFMPVEREAAGDGFTLPTLDIVREGAADRLYRRLGWTAAGVIPGYALDPSRAMRGTVVFYKAISGATETT